MSWEQQKCYMETLYHHSIRIINQLLDGFCVVRLLSIRQNSSAFNFISLEKDNELLNTTICAIYKDLSVWKRGEEKSRILKTKYLHFEKTYWY